MSSLTLKATSKRCFEPKVLMILIECLPYEQRPPIKELLTSYPVEIKLNLTPDVLEPTTEKILKRLGGVFIISK